MGSTTQGRIEKLSPQVQWQLLGLQFVDSADADPGTDAVDVHQARTLCHGLQQG